MGWRRQFQKGLERYLSENGLRQDARFPPISNDGSDPDAEDEKYAGEDEIWTPLVSRVYAAQVAEVAERNLEWWAERLDPDSPPEWAISWL
jgi:hypothetical protein